MHFCISGQFQQTLVTPRTGSYSTQIRLGCYNPSPTSFFSTSTIHLPYANDGGKYSVRPTDFVAFTTTTSYTYTPSTSTTISTPRWPVNLHLLTTFNIMVLQKLEIFVDSRLFLENVIEVNPHCRRVAMLIRTIRIIKAQDDIVI